MNPSRMHVRRPLAVTTAALLLAAPMLTSCGFNASTERVSNNTVGLGNRTGTVKILAAVVVASQQGSGTFIATLSNKDDAKPQVFDSLLGAGGNTIVASDFAEVMIAPRGFVNLADAGGVKISGAFGAGDVLPLSMGFADGETLDLEVPVVRACEEYAGLDPAGSATASTSPSQEPSATSSSSVASPTPTGSGSAAPGEVASAAGDLYSCDYAPSSQ